MNDPPTPARDRLGGSRRPSNGDLNSLPPLGTFSSIVEEQTQQDNVWRAQHQQQQQQPPTIDPALLTLPSNALAANALPANVSWGASWSTSSPNNTPSRNAQSSYQQQSQGPSHKPYSANASPSHPLYPSNLYNSGLARAAPAVVGSTPPVTNTLRPTPAQSSPSSYDYTGSYGQPGTNEYQFDAQSIVPGYQQPFAPSLNPSYLDQPPQSFAPSLNPSYLDQSSQAVSAQQYEYANYDQCLTGRPQQAFTAQKRWGYANEEEFLADRPDLAHAYLQRKALFTGTSLPADTQQAVYSQHQPETLLHSQLPTLYDNSETAPPSDSLINTSPPELAWFSEDVDWEPFEAEVISNTPTSVSTPAVARNTAIQSGTRQIESSLSLESSSVQTHSRDAAHPSTPKPPQGSPFEPSPVEIDSHEAVRPAVPEAAPNPPAQSGLVDKEDAARPSESQLRPRAKNWSKVLERNINLKPSVDGFPLGPIVKNKNTNLNAEKERLETRDVEIRDTKDQDGDVEMNQDKGKRKASEDPESPVASKRIKHAESAAPESKPTVPIIPFPEKPAVLEERNGEIEFNVVNNDGAPRSMVILTHLKCIFQKQLPKMPKDYIARLVYDRTHLSIAIVKKPLEVVGGITFRPFKDRKFAEIVFCAISSDQQVKGYGAHLMAHLKDYVQSSSPVMHFLTYADNYAIGYFKKQGFTKEITLEKSVWMGYIKDYEGGTIMQCTMLPRVRYLENGRMLLKQKETVETKIRATSSSHVVHQPPKQWKNGVMPIDPMSIPAIRNAGWSPEMDELARQPRRGANYNSLVHLLNSMQNHQSAWPFLAPVNRDEVQDYYEVIKEPMDLSTMEQKLEADKYPNTEDFLKDAMLIFKNCRQYNSEGTPYTKMANKLEKFVWSKVREIPEWSHLEEELTAKK